MTEDLQKIEIEEVTAYIEKISKLSLIPEQIEVLKSLINFDIKLQIIVCGRAFSKSFLCAGFTMYLADVYSTRICKPLTILLISHQEEIYVKFDQFFNNCPELAERLRTKGDKYNMPREGFQFKDNLSKVLLRLDTSHQIKGNDASITIIDEAQSVDENIVFKDAMPTARRDIKKFVLVGTPEQGSYFSEKIKNIKKPKSKDHALWNVSNYPSTVCPWLRDQIPIWQHELSKEDFTTEVLAETPNPSYNSPWNKKKLNKQYIETDPSPLKRPNCFSICGLDLAQGKRDKTGLVIIERNRTRLECKVIFAKLYTPDWMVLANIIKQYNCKFCLCDSQPQDLASKVKTYVEPFCKTTKFYYVNQTGIKNQMVAQLTELINKGHITICKPSQEELYKQLLRYYKNKQNVTDLVDALMLACFQSPDYPIILTEETKGSGGFGMLNNNDKYVAVPVYRGKCPSCGVEVTSNVDPKGNTVYCSDCYDAKFSPVKRKSDYDFTLEQQKKMLDEYKRRTNWRR